MPGIVKQINCYNEPVLRNHLLSVITNVPEAALMMQKLIHEMQSTKEDRERHCVRCHRSFDSAENREDSCRMRHIGPYERFATPAGWDSFGYRCCGPGGGVQSLCWIGRHTLDKNEAWKYLYASAEDIYFPHCEVCGVGGSVGEYNTGAHHHHGVHGEGSEEEEEESGDEGEGDEGGDGGGEGGEGEEEDAYENEDDEDEEGDEDEDEDEDDESINSDDAGSGNESENDFQGDPIAAFIYVEE
tara:strand:- start:1584 stop:2312 length:729 start_codon:yes stop_codon:yes gene_type:complete